MNYLLSGYPENILQIWFGDDESKRKEFGRYLLDQERIRDEDLWDELRGEDDRNAYDEMREKAVSHKCGSIKEAIQLCDKLVKIHKKEKKGKKYFKNHGNEDLGIATYMNSAKYRKSYLNKDEYRSSLKKIAKTEKEEIKEAIKLGYIKSKDPDEELKRLQDLAKGKRMKNALDDAYIQKHFL